VWLCLHADGEHPRSDPRDFYQHKKRKCQEEDSPPRAPALRLRSSHAGRPTHRVRSEQLQLPALAPGEDLEFPSSKTTSNSWSMSTRSACVCASLVTGSLCDTCANAAQTASDGPQREAGRAPQQPLVQSPRGSGRIPYAPSNSGAWASIFAPRPARSPPARRSAVVRASPSRIH
jgi:hypothetical protein